MTLPRADDTAAARGIAKQIGWFLAGVAVVIAALVAGAFWLFF